MRRALHALLGRERRREAYGEMIAAAGLPLSPRAGWLLLRAGEYSGCLCRELARHLSISAADLDDRLAELVAAGYVEVGGAGEAAPMTLTAAGKSAHARLLAARQDRVARLLDDWHPEHHPRLLELLQAITHELAVSPDRPGRDLDVAGAAKSRLRR